MIDDIIEKSMDNATLSAEELRTLFETSLFSDDGARIRAAGRRKSERASGGHAEVHAQLGINIAACPRNCLFCSFAASNKVFDKASELTPEELVERARRFETDGANAIYLMGTANYAFGKFIERAQEVRRAVKPDTVLVANVGDFSVEEGRRLKEAGFAGVYHAVRMGEGQDTDIPPERRIETFRAAREAGLMLGTCVEPVGPEHTIDELIEKTLITRDARPVFSGSARRIVLPGTELSELGTISEARLAHYVAIVRLALDDEVTGNCTHEPGVAPAMAGAQLMWAEAGSNPRDTSAETEDKRGLTVPGIRRLLAEAEFPVLDGPSRIFASRDRTADEPTLQR